MTDPMANPGRRLTEVRKLQRAKRLADPLYLELLRERFGTSVWWTDTPPPHPDLTDKRIQRFIRRWPDGADPVD